jgi:hypothetical protein
MIRSITFNVVFWLEITRLVTGRVQTKKKLTGEEEPVSQRKESQTCVRLWMVLPPCLVSPS